jgi:FkbM family methyltransferase
VSLFRALARSLSPNLRYELRRLHHQHQIRHGTFVSPEPEFQMLEQLVQDGDWVIDVGANLGHYTSRLSDLVGPRGRVLAFEPIPTTFSLLAAHARSFPHQNVTLYNAAISDGVRQVAMAVPRFHDGLENYYQAHIVNGGSTDGDLLNVLTMSLDALEFPQRISLVKIDAEGHEDTVLAGMEKTLVQHGPTLIVESPSPEFAARVEKLGYRTERLAGSPNTLFVTRETTGESR